MRSGLLTLALCAALSACGGNDDPAPAVRVYQSLGSLQCTGGGTTAAALQLNLQNAGVSVSRTQCGSDGRVYPAVCGALDGKIAAFDIPSTSLSTAQSLGFAPLSDMPEATLAACTST